MEEDVIDTDIATMRMSAISIPYALYSDYLRVSEHEASDWELGGGVTQWVHDSLSRLVSSLLGGHYISLDQEFDIRPSAEYASNGFTSQPHNHPKFLSEECFSHVGILSLLVA